MTRPRIPDEVVARAVAAKGQVRDHGGIGASMRAALEAVWADLVDLARHHHPHDPQETPR